MFNKKNERAPDLEVFTIYDSKVGAYDIPSFAINRHDLVRQVINMFKDPRQSNNKFLLNAEDYQIFKIGSYDKATGCLTTCNPEHIANVHELKTIAIQTTEFEKSASRPDLGIVPT